MRSRHIHCVFIALTSFGLAEARSDYLSEIKPVLAERCYACHGALKQKAGLRLDSAEHIHAGGSDGEVLSKLLGRITSEDPVERMPPEGKPLSGEEIGAIRAWLDSGAPIPEGERAEDDPRDHWAFQRIERPPVPSRAKPNPIDAFLAAKRAEHGLNPQGAAQRTLLIRRVYLDLIGLPPTLEELHDDRPWEVIVDELLARPQHGERWGRHWMDIWRYSDWYGLGEQLRNSQKHLWHWRDWIVESLNSDKGYDRMILEMLAGDELAPEDPEIVRATGFLARNYYLFNRTTWLDSTIEHTGKAFLGLTLNCAKCHDHKYDPISQLDYYRFRAIFEPHQVRLDPVPGTVNLDRDGIPRVFDERIDDPTFLHVRGDEKQPDKGTIAEPGVPEILASFAAGPDAIDLPFTAFAPGARGDVQDARLAAARDELEKARAALAKVPPPRPVESQAASDFVVEDGFDAPDDELWEIIGDDWEFREGALHKTRAGRDDGIVRLRKRPPRDFELIAHYTTTGGTTYKSVAFRFDRSGDGKSQHQVYTSAHAPGPKVQVSHTVDGENQYPPAGRVSRPIEIGKRYELKLAVRDRLLNVWLDGEFVLAYRLPARSPDGSIAISAFDATAAFDSISIRALAPEVELCPASSDDSLELAQALVAWREAELAAVGGTVAADRARYLGEGDPIDLGLAAANAQHRAKIAKAAMEIVRDRGDAGKLAAAQQRLAAAEEAGSAAEYTPIRASRKALESPEHKFDDYSAIYPQVSSGRRLALARWIIHRDNPLTARVAANHVWMRHFGEPLVESVFDFGRRARPPEQAELLDFLAVELIDSGWSMKHLHRLIIGSAAYRASSSKAGADPRAKSIDPDNSLYWRANPRRMESQLVRDSLLHLAESI